MKTKLGVLIVLLTAIGVQAQPTNLTALLQQGLFEEQANRNLDAAIADYQTLAAQFDKDRQLAATAVFRLGECYRMQGKTNEAALEYQRILRDFSDQTSLATLSRQDLAGMGLGPSPATAATPNGTEAALQVQSQLLQEEIKLAQQKVQNIQAKIDIGTALKSDLLPAQKELLELQRQLAALGATGAQASEPGISDAKLWSSVKDLPPAELRKVLPNLIPDATLTSLLDKYDTAEANLAVLTNDYAGNNVQVQRLKSDMDTLNHQITDQIDGMMQALKMRAELSQPTVAVSAPTDAEDQEIQRIKEMIQNSPDLINGDPLCDAVRAGQLRVATFLLDHGANANTMAGNGELPLVSAASNGHKAMTELLLGRGADVNASDRGGYTALLSATSNDQLPIVELLLAHKADVNEPYKTQSFRYENGDSALHVASEKGYVNLVSLLLTNGANVNAKNDAGETPIFRVIQNGQPQIVQMLLAAGANPNPKNRDGRTPLSYAVELSSPEIVKALLAAKADPNGGKFDAPLLCAVDKNDLGCAELLLQADANPNVDGLMYCPQGSYGSRWNNDHSAILRSATPLWLAIQKHQLPMVQLLLKYKANPDDSQISEPPAVIFWALSNTNILQALLDAGANPNIKNNDGRTPLSVAAENGSPEAVKLLLAAKADPNADTKDAPLLCAINAQNLASAELLLRAGANPNAAGKLDISRPDTYYSLHQMDLTPLWLAINLDSLPTVQLLLKYKADPNDSHTEERSLLFAVFSKTKILEALLGAGAKTEVQDSATKEKPLDDAAGQNRPDAVEILLNHGANPNNRDANGNTPLHYASLHLASREVFELLLDHHADPNVRSSSAGWTPLGVLKAELAANNTSPEQKAKAIQLADLLRQHGALDVLPDWDRITVSRQGSDYSATVFQRDTNGWNHFTLLEAILNYYESKSGSSSMWTENGGIPYPSNPAIPFPDLSKVAILHPNHDSTNVTRIGVNLLNGANGIDCAKDVPLEFGDTVKIPEREHTLAESDTNGPAWIAQISSCLRSRSGTVKLIVANRQTIQVPLNQFGPLDCRVGQVLDSSQAQNVLTSASDLSRVKVIRRDPKTGKSREWILNFEGQLSAQPPGVASIQMFPQVSQETSGRGLFTRMGQVSQETSGLWLRDGDVIEVPEKR